LAALYACITLQRWALAKMAGARLELLARTGIAMENQ
jgi:hypothetical protein